MLIMGSPLLTIQVKITKEGDPSYGSVFHLNFPNLLKMKKVKQLVGDTDVKCFKEDELIQSADEVHSTTNEDKTTDYWCDFGNPMYNDTGVEFLVMLEVPRDMSRSTIYIQMNATTLSNENVTSDNHQDFNIDIRNHVHLSLSG